MKDSVAASEVHALVRQTLPFFYSNAPRYFTAISDHDLALLMPVLVYWSASLFFHALDVLRPAWSEKFRLHEPEELKRRNRVSMTRVILMVMLQHCVVLVGHSLVPVLVRVLCSRCLAIHAASHDA